ncbi:DUF481 domain-containing protein [Chitinophaga barathri]|uniref:DUF481 domain-containing protein n=1 Tax=Chitinophaga barathri TaxID=1647451 RepID=A0A3N4M6U9_9BACT|nr:DUF481 domain-containing protein [Chitinophaga barathri]RPD39021.1 DUF481 domain-containing protein [Chitinophaga barathri]
MKNIQLLFLFVLLSVCPRAAAQVLHPEDRDEVVFYNDDKLIGEIKRMQRGELVFDPDKIDDDVTINLKDVKILRARRIPYVIEDIYTKKYYGTMEQGIGPGWVKIMMANDTADVFVEDLDNIHELEANFWKRLTGNVSLGFSFTRSSNIGRINGSNSLSYATRLWTYQLTGDIIYTIDEEFRGIEKADLALGGYIEFWKKWFSVTQVQYQRITELGVTARIQGTEGLGPILIKNRHNDLRLATGVSVQQEYSADSIKGDSRSSSVEIPVFFNYYLFRLGTPRLQLQVSNNVFFSTTQPGRWRFDQNTTVSWKIIKHLNTDLQLYTNFDSKPLDASARKVDYGVVFSIGYSW